jgi:uncharacterized protein YecE (DUF72 family)
MSVRKPVPVQSSATRDAPTQLDLFEDAFPVIEPRRIVETPASVLISCAGWNVPSMVGEHFSVDAPAGTSHLERYASVLPAVEINTSFYRPHLPSTYARWRDSVPPGFRFSVKVPRTLTHEARLQDTDGTLNRFLNEVRHLGEKLGCLLVQLPPSLVFDAFSAELFFDQLRMRTDAPVVCEPRHSSWFGGAAADMLARLEIAYVRADPPPVTRPIPPGYEGLVYMRLHGRPVIYRSAYAEPFLQKLAADLAAYYRHGRKVWCVFDNTAEGHAMPNALSLLTMTEREMGVPVERRLRKRKPVHGS